MAAGDDTLAALAQHAPCGLLTTAPRGQIVAINATLLGWLGYRDDELVGVRRFQELMRVSGRIFYETHFAPLLRMQGFINEIAVELSCKDGSSLPVFVSATESRDDAGEVEAIRVAVFQAADRRAYERELLLARRMAEQALKAKSDFMGVFAHEVRNGLATVLTAAEAVDDAGVSPAAQRPLAICRRSLDRVLGLLEGLLDFSKIEAGKAELQRRRFDPRELVQGVTQTLEPLAARKQLALETRISPAVPPQLLGDAVKLGQVLNNLVGNAVKFTEEGAVTVSVESLGRAGDRASLRFRVSDTGIGIAPERLAGIFDEYAQAAPEIGARYGGVGLGLAICRRIVELHGSKLQVDSQPGAGTTFSFELALEVASDDQLADRSPTP